MARMSLGAYTLLQNPIEAGVIEKDKSCASVLTYTSVGYFSWGTSIIGKQVILGWNYMRSDQYASLQTLYEADVPVVFNPQDGRSRTYNVEITNLSGNYFEKLTTPSSVFRKDARLTLLILSQV
jgi:hypothetical protein